MKEKDLKNTICLLCKNNKFEKISLRVRDSKNYKIIQCKKCQHIQLNPIPTWKEDKEFYDKNLQMKNIQYSQNINELKKITENDTQRRVKFSSKLVPKGSKILEIGSGHGFFLESMRELGYDITGIEISKEKKELAKKVTKAKILNVNINEKIPSLGKFDFIVMFHVLEHITDPTKFLSKIKKLLKINGKIIIEVPNVNDFQLSTNGDYRKFYWQRAHIHYFNPPSLKKVIKNNLLKVRIVGVQRYSIENMFNWKLTKKPQMSNPTFCLLKEYFWLEQSYKNYLTKNLICDTIIAIVSK